jgi:integrase
MAGITEASLRKFQNSLVLENGLSRSRANNILAPMRAILNQAYRAGEIDRDHSLAVKRLQSVKTKIDPFSQEDLALALSHIHLHYQPFFTVQAYSGARPAELLALRWRDIDWVNEHIAISKARVRGYEGLPKTASGERLIPMTRPVKEALEHLKVGPLVSLDDFVFVNTKGRPIDNHLSDVWDKALKRAGLRHRPSYQLRHTFITQCILKGHPLPYIAKIVGHSTIDTLIRHYARWIESATKEAENKLRQSFDMSAIPFNNHLEQKVGVKVGVLVS